MRFLILGQKLTPFWGVKSQNFRESAVFQHTIIIFQKLLIVAAYSFHQRVPPFNYQQCSASLLFLDGIYVTYSVPEGYSVTLIGKIV